MTRQCFLRSLSGTKIRYKATRQWHFVDIEPVEPNLASACFGHPPLPPGVPASKGPPQACVIDKINQFAAELSSPTTSAPKQFLALKFLLHFVGDLHQPLHAADDHDAGGNKKLVSGEGVHPGNLHHYWDVEFVERLGTDPRQVAATLDQEDLGNAAEGVVKRRTSGLGHGSLCARSTRRIPTAAATWRSEHIYASARVHEAGRAR